MNPALKRKRLFVTAFDIKGYRIKSFKSLHEFRKFANASKFDSSTLNNLRRGKLLTRSGYILGATKYWGNRQKVNPLRSDLLTAKARAVRRNNYQALSYIYESYKYIIILDGTYALKEIWKDGAAQLAKRENITRGTLKGWLSRGIAKLKSKNKRANATYYIFLRDLPKLLRNIRKSRFN